LKKAHEKCSTKPGQLLQPRFLRSTEKAEVRALRFNGKSRGRNPHEILTLRGAGLPFRDRKENLLNYRKKKHHETIVITPGRKEKRRARLGGRWGGAFTRGSRFREAKGLSKKILGKSQSRGTPQSKRLRRPAGKREIKATTVGQKGCHNSRPGGTLKRELTTIASGRGETCKNVHQERNQRKGKDPGQGGVERILKKKKNVSDPRRWSSNTKDKKDRRRQSWAKGEKSRVVSNWTAFVRAER